MRRGFLIASLALCLIFFFFAFHQTNRIGSQNKTICTNITIHSEIYDFVITGTWSTIRNPQYPNIKEDYIILPPVDPVADQSLIWVSLLHEKKGMNVAVVDGMSDTFSLDYGHSPINHFAYQLNAALNASIANN